MTDRLDAVPGANRVTVENVVAEIGVDMNQFPLVEHLAPVTFATPVEPELQSTQPSVLVTTPPSDGVGEVMEGAGYSDGEPNEMTYANMDTFLASS